MILGLLNSHWIREAIGQKLTARGEKAHREISVKRRLGERQVRMSKCKSLRDIEKILLDIFRP